MIDKVKSASHKLTSIVTSVQMKSANNPVQEAHAVFLFIFSIATIVMCCASTTFCVRAARDGNIAMNAMNIRRKYQRNMQLYMIVKEKKMIDKQLEKQVNGQLGISMTDSRSFTETSYDESSSCLTESQDADSSCVSQSRGHGDHATAALMHPNDMILEQSNDGETEDEHDCHDGYSDSSSMERLAGRVISIIGEPENISLILEDRIIADPVTE